MAEQQMRAAASRRMGPCCWQSASIEMPPQACPKVLDVDVDGIDAGELAGGDCDHLSGAVHPELEHHASIVSPVIKPMQRSRCLVRSAEEHLEALGGEFQRVVERAHDTGASASSGSVNASGYCSRTSATSTS